MPKPNSGMSEFVEFLGIILRVLRLETSVYIEVYIKNQFQTTLLEEGGGG